MKKISVVLIGAGLRGIIYTDIMKKHPEQFEVVAVAEPIDSRRNYIKELHGIADDMCFDDWKPLLEKGKIADMAIIGTMDRDHFDCTMKAIDLKYDLLLEKPIAPTAEECKLITENAEKTGVKVVICTVLRYTDIFMQLKDIIDSGRIGDVISINHEECVGHTHQSHSFVRGNWGNSKRSSTMLLQKSCHDTDILQWLIGKKCKKVQSFGALTYFKEKNAPEGATQYCIDGCPHADTCPYSAIKLYLESDNEWFRSAATREHNPTDDMVREAISTTQYGKCVFKCDNDVVDHQVLNMLFEDDVTVSFTMNAFNKGGRFMHIMGTKGEIHAAMDGKTPIEIFSLETGETETVELVAADGMLGGHGGGDVGIIQSLYEYLNDEYQGKSIPEIGESCYSHYLAFAAEESRLSGTVVDVEEYINSL